MVTDDQPLPHLYRRILGPAAIGGNAYRHRLGRLLHLRLSRSGQRDRPRADLDRFQLLEFAHRRLWARRGRRGRAGLPARARRRIPARKPGQKSDRFADAAYPVPRKPLRCDQAVCRDRRSKEPGRPQEHEPGLVLLWRRGGAAVLGLLPMPKPITIGDQQYHVVLVPPAPVPVGGCLVYVPVEWVTPADFGVEALMSIYVSMGVTTPQTVDRAPTLRS